MLATTRNIKRIGSQIQPIIDLLVPTGVTIVPVEVVHNCCSGAQAQRLSRSQAVALEVFNKKILSKIFDSIQVGDKLRIRMNKELYDLLNDVNRFQRINIPRLCLLDHFVWMEKEMIYCFRNKRTSAKEQIVELKPSFGVSNWRRRGQSRGA